MDRYLQNRSASLHVVTHGDSLAKLNYAGLDQSIPYALLDPKNQEAFEKMLSAFVDRVRETARQDFLGLLERYPEYRTKEDYEAYINKKEGKKKKSAIYDFSAPLVEPTTAAMRLWRDISAHPVATGRVPEDAAQPQPLEPERVYPTPVRHAGDMYIIDDDMGTVPHIDQAQARARIDDIADRIYRGGHTHTTAPVNPAAEIPAAPDRPTEPPRGNE